MWTEQFGKMLDSYPGRFGVIVKNLRSAEVLFQRNADMVMPSASIIKLPILTTLMDEAAAGRVRLDEPAIVPDGGFVGGAGLFMHMTGGHALTWRDHGLFMITLSDNDSTNMLISLLGAELINQKIREIGMTNTVLARKMMDLDAKKRGKDNFTTCADMLRLFERLYGSADAYADALYILKRQQHNHLLAGLLDNDAFEFAHKTGGLPRLRHDIGIMYLREPIFVAFMSCGLDSETDGHRLAHELGLFVYESYK